LSGDGSDNGTVKYHGLARDPGLAHGIDQLFGLEQQFPLRYMPDALRARPARKKQLPPLFTIKGNNVSGEALAHVDQPPVMVMAVGHDQIRLLPGPGECQAGPEEVEALPGAVGNHQQLVFTDPLEQFILGNLIVRKKKRIAQGFGEHRVEVGIPDCWRHEVEPFLEGQDYPVPLSDQGPDDQDVEDQCTAFSGQVEYFQGSVAFLKQVIPQLRELWPGSVQFSQQGLRIWLHFLGLPDREDIGPLRHGLVQTKLLGLPDAMQSRQTHQALEFQQIKIFPELFHAGARDELLGAGTDDPAVQTGLGEGVGSGVGPTLAIPERVVQSAVAHENRQHPLDQTRGDDNGGV